MPAAKLEHLSLPYPLAPRMRMNFQRPMTVPPAIDYSCGPNACVLPPIVALAAPAIITPRTYRTKRRTHARDGPALLLAIDRLGGSPNFSHRELDRCPNAHAPGAPPRHLDQRPERPNIPLTSWEPRHAPSLSLRFAR